MREREECRRSCSGNRHPQFYLMDRFFVKGAFETARICSTHVSPRLLRWSVTPVVSPFRGMTARQGFTTYDSARLIRSIGPKLDIKMDGEMRISVFRPQTQFLANRLQAGLFQIVRIADPPRAHSHLESQRVELQRQMPGAPLERDQDQSLGMLAAMTPCRFCGCPAVTRSLLGVRRLAAPSVRAMARQR